MPSAKGPSTRITGSQFAVKRKQFGKTRRSPEITFATPIRLARLPGFTFCALFPAPGPGALDLRFFPRILFASSSFFFFWRSESRPKHFSYFCNYGGLGYFAGLLPALMIWSKETASWPPAMTEIGGLGWIRQERRKVLMESERYVRGYERNRRWQRVGRSRTESVWSARRKGEGEKERSSG